VLALRWKLYRDGQALLAVLPIVGISLPYAWPHALLYTAPAFVFVIWKFCLLFPAPLRGLAARILLYPLPLIAILELLDVSKIEDPMTLKLLDGFRTSTDHLNTTLNDLVEILIIKEKESVDQVWVSFEETCRNVQASVKSQIEDSGAMIHTNFAAASGTNFNPAYMESIFLNLITNSIKYSKKESKPIIFIYTVEVEDYTQLIFEDNGLGFNMAKVQNKIFGLYQKFHNHPESKGIGLYLVHSQITSLGGSIEVESEENEGTKFIISFPHVK
jgi:signal transduction histidine kinase